MTSVPITRIPISEIAILNPRARNRITFESIIASIRSVGLKKPITVNRRSETGDGHRYDLICGQGRLEAFQVLGETTIPAIVREATKEECLLRSLAENIARRHASSQALYTEVRRLRIGGYKAGEISRKLGIGVGYVNQLVTLLDKGETQLLRDVEMRRVPVSVALTIASGTDADIQRALSDAYQRGELRGAKLDAVKRIIARRSPDRETGQQDSTQHNPERTSAALIKEYRRHTERQRALVQRAVVARRRILIATSAMKQLVADEDFMTLLRAESLLSMPAHLATRVNLPRINHA